MNDKIRLVLLNFTGTIGFIFEPLATTLCVDFPPQHDKWISDGGLEANALGDLAARSKRAVEFVRHKSPGVPTDAMFWVLLPEEDATAKTILDAVSKDCDGDFPFDEVHQMLQHSGKYFWTRLYPKLYFVGHPQKV